MRIAQIAPLGELPWSGVLTMIVNLSAALARRGHAVEVWQLHDWDPEMYGDAAVRLDEAGVEQVALPTTARWWGLGAVAARFEASRDIDVAHIHSVFNPPNAAVARVLRAPYIVSPHGGYDPLSLARSRYRKMAYRRVLEWPMLRRAAAVVALTEVERMQVASFAGVHAAAVIPNGVRRPVEDGDRTAFRTEIGVAPVRRLAVFAGRLDVRHKGLDILVEAVAEVPGWHLALVGGDHRGGLEVLRGLVDRRGISDRVTFAGVRNGQRLVEALAGADLFTLTSRWEGLPMALLEALSLGTPALVSPAVERVVGVAAAQAGWVAESARTADVLRKLLRVDNEGWAAPGQAAKRLAASYDWDAVASRYEDVFQAVLRKRAS